MGINGTARVVDGAGYWGDEDGEYDPESQHTLYWTGATKPVPSPITKGLFYCQAPDPQPQVVVVKEPRQPQTQPRGVKSEPKKSDDFRDVYDFFVVDGAGDSVLDTDIFPDPSGELNDFLTSDDLWWDGEQGTKANGGKRIKLYAPKPWKPGSSYAHFDDATYDGGEDALMTAAGAKNPGHDGWPASRRRAPGPRLGRQAEEVALRLTIAPRAFGEEPNARCSLPA